MAVIVKGLAWQELMVYWWIMFFSVDFAAYEPLRANTAL